MISDSQNQKQTVVDILSKAFDGNASVNFVVGLNGNRRKRIRGLMEYCYEYSELAGDILISTDRKGCALVLSSEKTSSSWKTILLDIRLAIKVIGVHRLHLVLAREQRIKKLHPDKTYYHLWFIGVNPMDQSKGVGSKLLKEIIDASDRNGKPIYLETSVESNLPWYQKFGFDIYHKIDLGYTLYLLRRETL